MPNTGPAAKARRKVGLAGMTRAELYAQAKRKGIAGRSRMDKAALVRALSR